MRILEMRNNQHITDTNDSKRFLFYNVDIKH